MGKYVALLRGVNVGGKSLVKMADLRTCVEEAGMTDVTTYINSGNVFFSTAEKNELKLAKKIEKVIEATFKLPVRVVVISHDHLKRIIAAQPKGWGEDADWRYYSLFLLPPCDSKTAVQAIGVPKPEIETLTAGEGIVYQANDMRHYGKTRISKLVGSPIYQQITIRNFNTTRKLLELMEKT